MKPWIPAVVMAVLLAGPGALWAADAEPAGKPIDVVICLDVSGSMDGLINQAKMKLWDIVNDLAKIQPTPQLRVGLYSYGHTTYDKNAGWVRKEVDLTVDLDQVYQKLNALTINGGIELVARVCRDAIDQQKWSEDTDALKLIFVAGNEPASQDKQVTLKEVAEKARAKGIIINPIYCGPAQHRDARDWVELATLAGGKFANINQDRAPVAIVTPHDARLAELSNKLSTTYVPYGGREALAKQENQRLQDANADKAGAPAAAARAASKATGLYRNEAWDLVDRLKRDPKFDIKSIPEAELCEEMKKMTPEQRVAHVKEMAAKREAIQKEIVELAAKRQEYINEQLKKNPSAADKAFDEALRGALREQAAGKGIKIPE